ncbi:hypothetical protein CERSUDRAFT_71211 [Gelatoporia subvermispora B]|uniref:Uncharacterized protein n=1 Tax=Ceriporiopsis subvermispora (strain B) TaxID=914234 RepID=M2PW26_CERS8|nr:hypothetical protein CERSUDRAFT_71211 [Gelatoporia subvermispora B]
MPRHILLSRRANNDIVIRNGDEGIPFLFTVTQLRAYWKFDRRLRAGRFKPHKHAYPAGYESFVVLWHQDEDSGYRFVTYDPDTGETSIPELPPLPIDELAPLPPPPAAPPPQAPPQHTPEEVQAIQGSLIFTAGRHVRHLQMASRSMAARTERRKAKKAIKRAFGAPAPEDDSSSEGEDASGRRPKKRARKERPVPKVAITAPRAGPSSRIEEMDAYLSADAEGEPDPDEKEGAEEPRNVVSSAGPTEGGSKKKKKKTGAVEGDA